VRPTDCILSSRHARLRQRIDIWTLDGISVPDLELDSMQMHSFNRRKGFLKYRQVDNKLDRKNILHIQGLSRRCAFK
jgi:hypothetical protein